MRYLPDTNVCIEHLRASRRGKPSPVSVRLAAEHQEDVVICSVVRAELLAGALGGSDPDRESADVEAFLAGFPSLSFDDVAADAYARIYAELSRRGSRIGAMDFLIAAIALANGLTVVTHNARDFGRVPGLTTEDWQ